MLLNKGDYIAKMDLILSDQSKFVHIGSPTFKPIFQVEDRINKFLEYLKDKNVTNDITYTDLYCSG